MKKIIVVLIIFLFFGMFFSIDIFASSNVISEEEIDNEISLSYHDDQLDQNNTIGPISVGIVQGPPIYYRFAQSFKPTLNILTRVELYLSLGYSINDADIILSIRSDIYGNDLVSTSIKANDINQIGWYLFDFTDIKVIPEQTYFIVLQSLDYDTGCSWWFGGDTYNRGYSASQIYNQMWVFNYVDFLFKTYGLNNIPPSKPIINGPTNGQPGKYLTYTFISEDPEEDNVYYEIDWGDGIFEDWFGPFESNILVNYSHGWDIEGEYTIKARAMDVHGAISDWGTLDITILKSRAIYDFNWLNFLDHFTKFKEIFSWLIKG